MQAAGYMFWKKAKKRELAIPETHTAISLLLARTAVSGPIIPPFLRVFFSSTGHKIAKKKSREK